MASLWRDLMYGARTLRKNPAFTVTAVVTLALGIGASTAIFSVVNAVLLRPLPYPNADRLAIITSDMVARGVRDFPIAAGDIEQMREGGTLFSGIAVLGTFRIPTVDEQGNTRAIRGAQVSSNFLSVLGLRVAAGRDFTNADGTPPAITRGPDGRPVASATPPPPPALILGYDYWQSHYGGSRSVLGTVVQIGPARGEVVGIAPKGLELFFPPSFDVERTPDVYAAARIDWATASHINVGFRAIGRLEPGVSMSAAQSQMNTVAADLNQIVPIKKTAGFRLRVVPMHQAMVADVRPAILALMGGVVFVLLIACANVANLLLVRTSRRERELAVRAALGGNRLSLVRQMLAEALLIALGGAVLGVGLAAAGIRVLVALGPRDLPTIGHVAVDPTVLAFTVAAAVAAAALFGIVPALRASRPDVITILRSSGRTSELGGGKMLRNAVVTVEVALAFVLLIGTGLMLRSFVVLSRAEPGFDPKGLLTFTTAQPASGPPGARAVAERVMRQRLEGMPGVTGVAIGFPFPFSGREANARWGTAVAVNDPAAFREADLGIVAPGFFKVMRTRLIAGRTFTEADNTHSSTAVIVDRDLAQRAFPGQSALGKRLYMRYRSDTAEWVDVVGVVDQIRRDSPAADGPEQVYVTEGEVGFVVNDWFVRTNGDPARLESTVRSTIDSLAPGTPILDLKPMSAYLDDARAPTRFALILVSCFGAIAAILAAIGLYGVLSTVVRQRTAEIGVRMALGAPKERIFRQIVGEGMRLGAVGVGAGVLAALALTRSMQSMLVGVRPTDPTTFAAIALLFLAIAALSCWLPARRASALDPANALREE
jgi:putative ABC transport system permease protein